jgi:hypothetical protein
MNMKPAQRETLQALSMERKLFLLKQHDIARKPQIMGGATSLEQLPALSQGAKKKLLGSQGNLLKKSFGSRLKNLVGNSMDFLFNPGSEGGMTSDSEGSLQNIGMTTKTTPEEASELENNVDFLLGLIQTSAR